jgi:nucleoside-diphosphate-sugar epimerase
MRIFVTGGSGFLGSRMIRTLVKLDHEVFALARSTSSTERVRNLGATPISGDLEHLGDLALPKIEAVVHAAAYFRFAGPRSSYFRANVEGTRALLTASQNAGAATFIYLSAGAVIMDDRGSSIRDANERAPTFPNSFSGYIASKAQGEAAVLAANKPGFRTLAIRPPAIWGPGDPFSRALPDAIGSGKFAFIERGDYPFAICHVDNVIEAVQSALIRGTGGRAYFINDHEPTTFRDFVAMLADLQGLSIGRLKSVSYRLAFTLGRLMEIGAAITSSKDDPSLSRTLVRMIGREFTVSDTAARGDLGYLARVSRAEGVATYDV